MTNVYVLTYRNADSSAILWQKIYSSPELAKTSAANHVGESALIWNYLYGDEKVQRAFSSNGWRERVFLIEEMRVHHDVSY